VVDFASIRLRDCNLAVQLRKKRIQIHFEKCGMKVAAVWGREPLPELMLLRVGPAAEPLVENGCNWNHVGTITLVDELQGRLTSGPTGVAGFPLSFKKPHWQCLKYPPPHLNAPAHRRP